MTDEMSGGSADDTNAREYSNLLAPRVTHLDAQYLDDEIHDLLKTKLLDSAQLSGITVYTKFEPEIDAFLKLLIYRLTVVKSKASVGQRLLKLKYSKTVPEHLLKHYSLMLVLFPWLHTRTMDLCHIFIKNEQKRIKIMSYVNIMEVTYKIMHLLNLLVFLYEGLYSTVGQRIFKLRPIPTVLPNLRQISYAFFSRELLWNGFSELLGIILPLIPTQKVHSIIKSVLPSRRRGNEVHTDQTDEAELLSDTVCMLCCNAPILPYQFGCEHVACYYCISTKQMQQQYIECSLCGYLLEDYDHIGPVRIQTQF